VFTTPRTGMYYVLVDNSGAKRPAELSVYSYAKTPHPSAADVRTRDIYEGLYRELGTLLDFDNVEIHVRRCGRVTAFSTPNVVICTEFEELMSSGANPGVRLFVLMHEVAHSFLYSWGYRSTYRNQFMTDRLAATLIEMMDREELAAEAAEWFAENESFTAPSDVGAPFAISRQRAQRIANWLNDDEQLDLLWTKRIVFPRMHTAALEAIMERAELEPRTRSRIASELTKRREDASP
jgi:hypothetical protein